MSIKACMGGATGCLHTQN